MAAADTDPILRLAALAEEVDRKFTDIRQRRGASMQCGPGCNDCCRARLSITRVEEALLRRGLARMPEEVLREMALAARDERREMCPALGSDGRCRIYASRPLACRGYGVPLRRRREVPLLNPPVIDVCDMNFVGTPLRTLPAEDVLEQTDLEAVLEGIDAEHCGRNGLPAGERVAVAQILASLAPSEREPV